MRPPRFAKFYDPEKQDVRRFGRDHAMHERAQPRTSEHAENQNRDHKHRCQITDPRMANSVHEHQRGQRQPAQQQVALGIAGCENLAEKDKRRQRDDENAECAGQRAMTDPATEGRADPGSRDQKGDIERDEKGVGTPVDCARHHRPPLVERVGNWAGAEQFCAHLRSWVRCAVSAKACRRCRPAFRHGRCRLPAPDT